ncbi:hypothetical protein OG21DRAFT_1481661 [Imleria badia]|nr:hypothetical protein OG21DRAFT_1481661 [Imleria badia]
MSRPTSVAVGLARTPDALANDHYPLWTITHHGSPTTKPTVVTCSFTPMNSVTTLRSNNPIADTTNLNPTSTGSAVPPDRLPEQRASAEAREDDENVQGTNPWAGATSKEATATNGQGDSGDANVDHACGTPEETCDDPEEVEEIDDARRMAGGMADDLEGVPGRDPQGREEDWRAAKTHVVSDYPDTSGA